MSTKIPRSIVAKLRKTVFEEADKANYLSMSKTDSGKFLNILTDRSDIGGEISKYRQANQVRYYIKDAILNRYSKQKLERLLPGDIKSIVNNTYEMDFLQTHSEDKLYLYRSVGRLNEYVVVSVGTYLKWESALKKSLLFISISPFSKTANGVHVILLLFANQKPIPDSDKKNLRNALKRCGAIPHFFGER